MDSIIKTVYKYVCYHLSYSHIFPSVEAAIVILLQRSLHTG
ncbi:hypothetical protein Lser_V15G13857 [Lactuca serriola]